MWVYVPCSVGSLRWGGVYVPRSLRTYALQSTLAGRDLVSSTGRGSQM